MVRSLIRALHAISHVEVTTLAMGRATTGIETDAPSPAVRNDEQLVRDCLGGKEEAWTELIDKYKNLIFSVPIKYGFSRDEAADIFQEVCFELLAHLKDVREPQALPKWLLMVSSSKCFHSTRRSKRTVAMDLPDLERASPEISPEALKVVAEAEQEQEVREAIASLSPRCQQLVKMLFFEEPPQPYQQVARNLGVATGSIGFIRQRCLEFLRKKIQKIQGL